MLKLIVVFMALAVLATPEGLRAQELRDSAEALRALKETISTWRGPGTPVLVTHGLTVRAITGIVPGQAETVVLKPRPGGTSGAHVVGRIPAPH